MPQGPDPVRVRVRQARARVHGAQRLTAHTQGVGAPPRRPISQTEIRDALLAGAELTEIAAHHEIGLATLKRRIKEARAEHGAGWGRPLVPKRAKQTNPRTGEVLAREVPNVDPSDRAAMHALTLQVLADTAAGSFRDADRINAAKALRDALSLDTLEQDAAAGGGFSPQDAAHLRTIQRALGTMLQQAIASVIAKADTDERFALVRDLYRIHAQPKAPADSAAKLAAALSALGPDLYAEHPLMRLIVS
jgi:hypothetical protein